MLDVDTLSNKLLGNIAAAVKQESTSHLDAPTTTPAAPGGTGGTGGGGTHSDTGSGASGSHYGTGSGGTGGATGYGSSDHNDADDTIEVAASPAPVPPVPQPVPRAAPSAPPQTPATATSVPGSSSPSAPAPTKSTPARPAPRAARTSMVNGTVPGGRAAGRGGFASPAGPPTPDTGEHDRGPPATDPASAGPSSKPPATPPPPTGPPPVTADPTRTGPAAATSDGSVPTHLPAAGARRTPDLPKSPTVPSRAHPPADSRTGAGGRDAASADRRKHGGSTAGGGRSPRGSTGKNPALRLRGGAADNGGWGRDRQAALTGRPGDRPPVDGHIPGWAGSIVVRQHCEGWTRQ